MFVRTGPRNIERYRKARELRSAGTPYKRIAMALQISPATAFAWTRDIQLTPEQEERNRRGPDGPQNPEAQRKRAAAWSARCRARRAGFQESGRRQARTGDLLHQAGCMLYWAEGTKRRNAVEFTNSDPRMVVLFRRFLTEALDIGPQCIRLAINMYTGNGLTTGEIERFWLDILDLPKTSVRKHTINHFPTSSSGRARKKLPYGVCRIEVHSTWAIQHIYGAIQEYVGFEEPRWLD
jgi:hypothetical protein